MIGRAGDNPWQILGVEPTCTFEEARAAYKIRLQLNHPDRHSGSSLEVISAAARETQRINRSWSIIKSHFSDLARHETQSAELQQESPDSVETLLEKIKTAQAALGTMPSLAGNDGPTAGAVHAAIAFDLRRRALTQLQLELVSLFMAATTSEMDRAVWAKAVDAWRFTLELNQIALDKHLKLRAVLMDGANWCSSCQRMNTIGKHAGKMVCGYCGALLTDAMAGSSPGVAPK